MRRTALLVSVLFASACSFAPRHTDEELALLERAGGRGIAPATAEARAAIGDQELVAQAAFWAQEYENNPADREAAAAYASVARRLGNASRAAQVANQALSFDPDNVDLLKTLGAALIEDGRAPAAVAPLTRAVGLAGRDADALNLLGAALDHVGDHDAARARYHEALELSGEDAGILANLGLSHLMAGDPYAAEPPLRAAAGLPGADARIRSNLGLALALQGRFEEAETVLQQDLSVADAASNIAYVRAMLSGPRRWDVSALDGGPGLRGGSD